MYFDSGSGGFVIKGVVSGAAVYKAVWEHFVDDDINVTKNL